MSCPVIIWHGRCGPAGELEYHDQGGQEMAPRTSIQQTVVHMTVITLAVSGILFLCFPVNQHGDDVTGRMEQQLTRKFEQIDTLRRTAEDVLKQATALMESTGQIAAIGDIVNISHLKQPSPEVAGPVQDDEALFLYSLVRLLRPKRLAEFGVHKGDSGRNFLAATESDAVIYGFDIVKHDAHITDLLSHQRYKFILKDQAQFVPADVDSQPLDFVFLDAGHSFESSSNNWKVIEPSLGPRSIAVVHDTGLHSYKIPWLDLPGYDKLVCETDGRCGYQHQMGERKFVNWIIETYPEWRVVNIHSVNTLRHGLSVLQRSS
eukprot:TRINITY_DN1912_c0_g1_i1.p1 TRINITY_DN1912_c0_g1~~TRINITY_DN1912_c0_g1_i1.p1  ORF type:complete len:319 (-),score=36.88 TRINITY_DN1912_c0_g1_i1:313-1269(-)